VVIKLDVAIPNMESQLIYQYILPEHIWGKLDAKAAVEFQNTEMIGSGPFQMAEYKQNEFIHLKAFANNHRFHPKVTDVVFQTFQNQDALVQAIKTGQVDMITEMPSTAITSLKNADNVTLVSGPPMAPYASDIIFNQVNPEDCPKDAGGKCTGHPALRDKNVRLALAHATDKKQIIQVVKLGFATPGLTLIPDGLKQFYNSDLKDYDYDPAQANKILDDAGYKDVDGDGIREMPDGKNPLNFRLNWPSDSTTGARMAELLNDMWKQIGIGTQLQAVDADALTATCCPAFDYDVILWGWGSDPDPSALLDVMTSKEIATGSSETGYSNPDYDKLYEGQSVELDKDKRSQMVRQMQQIVFDDVVYIVPFYEQAVQAYRTDRFKGWLTKGRIALEDVSSLAIVEPVK
jgi:peptide/nickel transport system substrate-binding protein